MARLLWLIPVVFLTLGGAVAASETPRSVTWDDLVPKDAQYPEDPLSTLSPAQKEDVAFILRAHSAKARTGRRADSSVAIEVRERKKMLLREGVDVDRLLARVREVEAAWRDAEEKVEPSLDGQLIRLPGYVLPLAFAGSKVVEFLLVPFAGACIHAPPPPHNQIIHVRTKNGFTSTELFMPVYVTGHVKAKGLIGKSVYLKEGNVNVSYGYAMVAERIEPYKDDSKL